MKRYEGLCNQKSEVLLESLPLSRGEGLKISLFHWNNTENIVSTLHNLRRKSPKKIEDT